MIKETSSKMISRKKIIKPSQTGTGGPTDDIPKKLTPHDIFLRCIKRAQNLINFHTENDEQERGEQYGDAYRAAVVLSISALDAFIKTIVTEKINEILSDSKKNLPDELSNYIKNLLNLDKLLDAARKYNIIEVVNQHIKEDFQTKSFQGGWKINAFMELGGYKDIFNEVSRSENVNKDNLIKDLNTYTQRRHVIAHNGDYDLNSTIQIENKIDKKFTQDCVNFVTNFADHINIICYRNEK